MHLQNDPWEFLEKLAEQSIHRVGCKKNVKMICFFIFYKTKKILRTGDFSNFLDHDFGITSRDPKKSIFFQTLFAFTVDV